MKRAHSTARTFGVAFGLATLLVASAVAADPRPVDQTQAPRGEEMQAPRGEETQAPRGQEAQAPRDQERTEAPRR